MRSIPALSLAVALAASSAAEEAAPRAFTFHEIRDGVYLAVGTGQLAVGANGAIVVGERDVLLVDSHMTPVAAEALLAELREVTDKPVRYVVNTHFHFDHVDGNQVFGPEVEILAHEFTREQIVAKTTRTGRAYRRYLAPLPERIAALEAELAAAPAEERAERTARIAYLEALYEADQKVELVPPSVTLSERLTLHRAGREVRLLFFGRGHTGGDVVVHLPQERVLVTGDLLTGALPYMGDGYLLEWADTLEEMKRLDFDTILPGHGEAYSDRARIDQLQAYLRDLWAKAEALRREGVSAEQAARRIDLTAHAGHFPQIEGVGADRDAVERVYELLDAAAGER